MSVAILGSGTFQDSCAPLKGKSEWGMDTLTRKMMGARSLAESFIASLAQGQLYSGYYLQTWDVDDNPDVATITLNYKGLVTGGTPLPKATTQIVSAVGETTADFSLEGTPAGLGRFYRQDYLWSVTSPSLPGDINGTSFRALRDRYAISARMDFTYKAVQTTYRYITTGRPFGPRYVFPDITYPAIIERARITLNDGTVLQREQWELFFSLTPTQLNENISFQAEPVIGSPFFECEDVARRSLGNAL